MEREWSTLAIVPLARRLQEDGLIRAGCIDSVQAGATTLQRTDRD